ncbi:CHAT domain-containing protein [Cupriavidus sp. CV2]|uniref:CHAT domain-containing protein n=1 Tax=Cupriavidus ulmosensis TaxID=3065913 RepID=UPI00296B46F2|nr:CHAT domain-containing protein [Cupriavidus sp. CV2]MDW3685449.1 CHAT domain-containing protein [Cupriavidus sp. CV2]
MPRNYSELEIVIDSDGDGTYAVEARHRVPEGDAITPRVPLALSPDAPALRDADPQVCGRALAASLFAAPVVRDAFVTAQNAADERRLDLRVRLRISVLARELHALPWETLFDPAGEHPLFIGQRCFFSRYLFAREMRLPKLRAKSDVTALVVVSNPDGLGPELAPIDAAGEAARASAALAPIPVTVLAEPGCATVERILASLRDGVDVLYLVCHGALVDDEPMLWLERMDGTRDLVSGSVLVNRIGALERPPSLVVLCSCQSAGTGAARGASTLMALGPLLAQAGVPAVLAMQGNVSVATMSAFMPVFFAELRDHGEVDRAAGVARAAVSQYPDWWMPAVFTRLDSGRIFYPPGFGPDEGDGADAWRAVIENIQHGETTPILGPAMSETVFGSRLQLAQMWAEAYHFPMAAHERDELPQVAQYLAVSQQGVFPRRLFFKFAYQHLSQQYRDILPAELSALRNEDIIAQLGEVVCAVGRAQRQQDPDNPYRAMARLKLPVYLTTDPSDLLADALREGGADPGIRLCRWNRQAQACDDALAEGRKRASPTAQAPMVLKLFGDLREPGSLVLTEDQYFDYLTSVSTTSNAIPLAVRARLNDSALLFVGFDVQSWEFRILFRSILNLEGADLRQEYQHLSAQLDPNSIVDPVSARRYLERYFQDKARLKLYWGDVGMFTAELLRRLEA